MARRDPDRPSPLPSLMPFVIIAAVLVLIYAGMMLFPVLEGWMAEQSCVASGHTNCGEPH